MVFNQVVQGFEDCLIGTTQLLLAGFMRPREFSYRGGKAHTFPPPRMVITIQILCASTLSRLPPPGWRFLAPLH
ncbi:uncharacterized protein ARMOST_14927 [Armillaria ostoyae]|uniref:Uncharacterized protein n=1 Tax=Armillaria ostoyae TaxID=47428 RepID=A0A284RRY4_ARMOS|nr:uncharacterized protein ARMOST_14927 [Armillaria ostoyae]